ncbi:PQQ-binding-like beta-propeller repeat protein [Kribbella sp. NPDC051586]|uniref:outer membrane protein assembly factor BamB family protein n=1 Tax=Kribbella sp. NPDC051586 TaxID=3364118 RepID=UPI0037A1692C
MSVRITGVQEYWEESLPEALRDEVLGRYGGKRVAYRERYLRGVLKAFDALEQLATDPTAVRLAVWFHRAEKDTEASARLAEELLPKYGVSSVRTAEVARLVRLTDARATESDANGNVLLDAINSVYADPRYSTHASEVRRASHYDVQGRRQQVEALLASERIYRTQLAHDRYETEARANLTEELATLDGLTPHPWRGWQRAALHTAAVLSALVAFIAGVAAVRNPWRIPAYSGDSVWPAVVLMLAALATVAVVYSAVRRNARIVAAAPAVVGAAGVLIVWLTTPDTNGASGVGQRVPMLMILSIMLVVAGAAAFAAIRFTRSETRNRGQLIAGVGAAIVVVLAVLLVIDPIQRAYLLSANEYLETSQQPANDARSTLAGGSLWTAPGNLQSLVATSHGIAIARARGFVEMLDPATGSSRWRYTRADTDDVPHLYSLNGGQQVLASYDDLGYIVLDADTGKRTAAWPQSTRDYDIDDTDPLITGKSVSKGSDKLYGTKLDGSNRWTYEPGRCTSIGATATDDTVVVQLDHSCGSEPDQLVGLNLKNGKKLWTRDDSINDLATAGGLVVGLQGRQGPLVGVDPRTGDVKWRSDIPTEWDCPLKTESSGDRVVLMSCPSEAQKVTDTVVRVVDARTGQTMSTASAKVQFDGRYAVTADGVVVGIGPSYGGICRLATVTDGNVAYHDLDRSISCGYGVQAAGNLVLVSGEDGMIALR